MRTALQRLHWTTVKKYAEMIEEIGQGDPLDAGFVTSTLEMQEVRIEININDACEQLAKSFTEGIGAFEEFIAADAKIDLVTPEDVKEKYLDTMTERMVGLADDLQYWINFATNAIATRTSKPKQLVKLLESADMVVRVRRAMAEKNWAGVDAVVEEVRKRLEGAGERKEEAPDEAKENLIKLPRGPSEEEAAFEGDAMDASSRGGRSRSMSVEARLDPFSAGLFDLEALQEVEMAHREANNNSALQRLQLAASKGRAEWSDNGLDLDTINTANLDEALEYAKSLDVTSNQATLAIQANTLVSQLRKAQAGRNNAKIEDAVSDLMMLFAHAQVGDVTNPSTLGIADEADVAFRALAHSHIISRFQHALSRDGASGTINKISYETVRTDRLVGALNLAPKLEGYRSPTATSLIQTGMIILELREAQKAKPSVDWAKLRGALERARDHPNIAKLSQRELQLAKKALEDQEIDTILRGSLAEFHKQVEPSPTASRTRAVSAADGGTGGGTTARRYSAANLSGDVYRDVDMGTINVEELTTAIQKARVIGEGHSEDVKSLYKAVELVRELREAMRNNVWLRVKEIMEKIDDATIHEAAKVECDMAKQQLKMYDRVLDLQKAGAPQHECEYIHHGHIDVTLIETESLELAINKAKSTQSLNGGNHHNLDMQIMDGGGQSCNEKVDQLIHEATDLLKIRKLLREGEYEEAANVAHTAMTTEYRSAESIRAVGGRASISTPSLEGLGVVPALQSRGTSAPAGRRRASLLKAAAPPPSPGTMATNTRSKARSEIEIYANEARRRLSFRKDIAELKEAALMGLRHQMEKALSKIERSKPHNCPNLYFVNAIDWAKRMYCSATTTLRGLEEAVEHCNSKVLRQAIEDAEDNMEEAMLRPNGEFGRNPAPPPAIKNTGGTDYGLIVYENGDQQTPHFPRGYHGRRLATPSLEAFKERLRVIEDVERSVALALTTLRVSHLEAAYKVSGWGGCC